ncbi:CBS domain-containing protein [Billgrantia endophytica]|uniref:Mannose-1-phosphate guanylyltransferase n=1 Tax=Billgrantia endophytica TaxID=2033802 RepID=A0A2N7TY04_9GAMM|nr:CBS domain-containing protein [Halomonas endophytica]PMR73053.1 mannose-1-phosphate guanylyltransferase [Halomonas endophytica]
MENLNDFVVQESDGIAHALKKIEKNHHGFLVVVDGDSLVKGVVTDGDIRRHAIKTNQLPESVLDVYVKDFQFLYEYDDFGKVAEKFKSPKNNFLPIVNQGLKLVNLLTKKQFHLLLLEDQEFKLSQTDFAKLNHKVIEHEIYNRPWGFYKSTVLTNHAQAKIITVFPGGELSLQEHKKREEHWVVIKGKGIVILGESELDAYPGKYIYIPKGCKHKAINRSQNENLVFSEVQLGDYFGEDDIIRYEDRYGRV